MKLHNHLRKIDTDPNYRYNYVIAEIGINHNGDLTTALELIEAAHMAGADAVKFQVRNLEEIYTEKILSDPNSAEWNFEYLIPILKDTNLNLKELKACRALADIYDIEFIVTPFDVKSAIMADTELGVDAFKIGSMDMLNIELVCECSTPGIPVIISTGMWTEKEIRDAVIEFDTLDMDYVLLLANSTYPTPYEAINLEFIKTLKDIHTWVGYSGHERGTFIPVAAAALGARVIEKHITFDRQQDGPDHKASMEPDEFATMVTHLRELTKSVGSEKRVNMAEQLAKQTFVAGTYVKEDLKLGHVLTESDVYFRSPGKGILRHEISEFYGKPLTVEVQKGENLSKEHFKEIIPIDKWKLPAFKQNWGVKCRIHDYDEYSKLNSPVIEFHMSEKDIDIDFYRENKESQLVVHAPEIFGRKLVDICSTDKDVVNSSIDLLQRSIDRTIEISKGFKGRPKFVVHLGGMELDDVLNPSEYMMSRAIDNFKRLNFNPDNIEVLPENLPPRPWYLGGQLFQYGFMTSEDMLEFCELFGLNMTLDVCHAALHCNHDNISLDGYVKKVLDRASHFHLSDAIGIDGEGVQVGEGTVNFNSLMDVISKKKENFSWVTEIWSGHINQGAGCRTSMHRLGKFNNII